jgi:putative hydrolase of the HAD superfamily
LFLGPFFLVSAYWKHHCSKILWQTAQNFSTHCSWDGNELNNDDGHCLSIVLIVNKFHLFFDLDRTLWDFEKNSEIALNILFHDLKLHLEIGDFQTFHEEYKEHNTILWKLYGTGKMTKEVLRSERFRKALATFDIDDPVIIDRLSDGYVELSPLQTAMFPNAIETVKLLKSEGYELHMITNGFREVQTIKIDNCGLAPYFQELICSEDIGKNKPDKDIFHYSMHLAGSKADQSVMIGDDYEVDILGANAVGMHTIHFDPEEKFQDVKGEWRIRALNQIPEILPWIFKG